MPTVGLTKIQIPGGLLPSLATSTMWGRRKEMCMLPMISADALRGTGRNLVIWKDWPELSHFSLFLLS